MTFKAVNNDPLELVSKLKNDGKAFLLATVVKSEGSTLAKPGFKTLFSPEGKVLAGGFGGGCPESAVTPYISKVMETGAPIIVKVHLEEAETGLKLQQKAAENEVFVETFCGGNLEIFLDPYGGQSRIIVIGQGGRDEVQSSLLYLAKWLGFTTVLINPTKTDDNPDVFHEDLGFDLNKFETLESDSIVVLTKGTRDLDVLTGIQNSKAGYIGLMASRKRIEKDFGDLKEKGVPEEFIGRIRAPVGLDIGSVTPQEIAISIISEIIAHKNKNVKKKDQKTVIGRDNQ